ncbi:MAG TPA: SGNH/GDSL hydrolase family protein [Thermoanaerobaculia bacterium]|nr:SGNH/GDSL hydrolase family protein [Thermoanaerobaculia bacterium]
MAFLAAEAGLRAARVLVPRIHGLTYSPTVRTAYEEVGSTRELLEGSYFGYQPLAETPGLRLSSRGFRTPEYREEKAPGTLRVVVLGDSFAFGANGVPYEALWHQVLGRELGAATGRPVEVINLGMPAVGPRFELRLWELEGRRLDADLVVLGFFVGNDLTDEGDEPLASTFEGDLAQRSVLVRLVRNALRRRTGLAEAAGGTGGAAAAEGGEVLPLDAGGFDPGAPLLTEEAWLDMEEGRLLAIAGPDTGRFRRLVAGANLLLERIARQVEASGARFVLLLIPDEGQVDRALARRIAERSGFALDLDRPQRSLLPWLADRRIPHLDLLPLFRRRHEAGGPPLYRFQDTHWSVAGNRLAGQALAEYVVEEELVETGR